MQNIRCVYINGEYFTKEEAKVSILDHGFMYGDGIFENVKITQGHLVSLDAHINRLYRSAKAVKLDIGMSKEELKRVFIETVRRSNLKDGNTRITVTRGLGVALLDPRIPSKPTIAMIAWEEELPETITTYHPAKEGMKLMVASIRRTPSICKDSRIKSISYMNNILARIEAIEAGYDDTIMLDIDNYVCEASAANIFTVEDGKLVTPPVTNVLEGVTRNTTIELAKSLGHETVERNMTVYDLYNADEVFLTANHIDIVPVREIDGRKIGDESPGPITKKLQELYLKWCVETGTPVYDLSE